MTEMGVSKFQFTPARGGRLASGCEAAMSSGFNSRPRAAGDISQGKQQLGRTVSIHARARRATLPGCPVRAARGVSIHARARRAT